ncbi:hypothetical protein CCP3SC1_120038 [Gammaproteobacteria bacterium]
MQAKERTWHTGYTCGPAGVDVTGNYPEDGAWLSAILHPWCKLTKPSQGRVSVHMTRSDAQAHDLEQQVHRAGTPVACFALDTRTVVLPSWQNGDSLWITDPEAGCFYGISDTSVHLIARAHSPQARLGLLRLVRELLTGGVLGAGKVIDLHAAAFTRNGKGVLLAGAKGAGKTSLLCHALFSGGAALLANDRVFVDLADKRPIMRGIPTMVAIRPGTLDVFSVLRLSPSDAHSLASAGPPSSPKLHLTPAEFARRLAAPCVSQAVLQAIVLPEISATLETWALERLSRDVAQARLESYRYGAAVGRTKATLFGAWLGGSTPSPHAPVTHLAQKVPVYRCTLGSGIYRTSALSLLHALGLDD